MARESNPIPNEKKKMKVKNIKQAVFLIDKMKPCESRYGYLKIELNAFLKTKESE